MFDSRRNWTFPDEAKVAVARLNRQFCERASCNTGSVQIQLNCAKSIRGSAVYRDKLGTQYFGIKAIGSFPIRNMDNAMIKTDRISSSRSHIRNTGII